MPILSVAMNTLQESHLTLQEVDSPLQSLIAYCRNADWAGWDPYDGLNSKLFQAIPFFQNKPCRLAFIQFIKRCPINLRPILGVPPGHNPKGLALFVTTLVKLSRLGLAQIDEARTLADKLAERRCPGQIHACWGYHFDWQTRGELVTSTTPNIVCTAFAANAFLDLYDATGHVPYLEIATSAGQFVTDVLSSDLPENEFCIRYYMIGKSTVHNASLMGAALLARIYGYNRNARLEPFIRKATQFSLDRQHSDGSWPYGEGSTQKWVDSFHTGYNLLALKQIGVQFEIDGLPEAIQKGYDYYRAHFFCEDGAVRYFHNNTYPIDAHAVGHALITLSVFSDRDSTAIKQASHCFRWAIDNLQARQGYFYYQKRPWFTNRISYIRWTQAWMLLGLTDLAEACHKNTACA